MLFFSFLWYDLIYSGTNPEKSRMGEPENGTARALLLPTTSSTPTLSLKLGG